MLSRMHMKHMVAITFCLELLPMDLLWEHMAAAAILFCHQIYQMHLPACTTCLLCQKWGSKTITNIYLFTNLLKRAKNIILLSSEVDAWKAKLFDKMVFIVGNHDSLTIHVNEFFVGECSTLLLPTYKIYENYLSLLDLIISPPVLMWTLVSPPAALLSTMAPAELHLKAIRCWKKQAGKSR